MPARPRGRNATGAWAVLALAVGLALLLVSPLPASAASPRASATQPAANGISASVTWNGVDIGNFGTLSSADQIDFSQSANLNYVWSNAPAPGINDARLQMFYFGFAVATRDVSISEPLTSDTGLALNWTPLSIGYVLEGAYRLTASLIAKNGTTMWSEDFYVRGNAPLGFVAVIPIVLLALAVYEIYALVRSGRYAALGATPKTPESTPPSGPGAASGGGTPPSSTPSETDSAASPPSEDAGTPPSGGSS